MFVVQFIWNVNTGLQCHTYICVCVAIVATSSWWCLASQVPYSHTSTKNNCITNFYFNVIGQGFSIIFSSHTTNYYKRLIAYLAHCVTPGHGICIYMAIIMHTTLLWSEMWLGHVSVCLSDRTSDRVVEMSAHQKHTNKKTGQWPCQAIQVVWLATSVCIFCQRPSVTTKKWRHYFWFSRPNFMIINQ